nr:enoyl-CoA hydratase-related protein [uncultured Flavobacterium sp.]
MALQNIILEHEKGIATIFINRPEKLNALNKVTIQELHETLQLVDENPDVRVVIITGSGEKAFVAGADIAEFAHFSVEEGALLSAKGQQLLFDFIENMKTPVIAAINGFALGGGLELAMACHFRIASENAKMGLPETSLGVIPGYGGTQRLPQIIGKGRAMEMIMTAGMIDAETAKVYGLVNHVVPQDELFSAYMTIATRIMKNSPVAISKAIEAVNSNYISGVNGFDVEIKNFGDCFATDDFKEGTTAFLEKRKAEFTGN